MVAEAFGWKPSSSAEADSRHGRPSSGLRSGSLRPGPAETNPARLSAVGPRPNGNASRRRPGDALKRWGPERGADAMANQFRQADGPFRLSALPDDLWPTERMAQGFRADEQTIRRWVREGGTPRAVPPSRRPGLLGPGRYRVAPSKPAPSDRGRMKWERPSGWRLRRPLLIPKRRELKGDSRE